MKFLCPRQWEFDNINIYTCVCHTCHRIKVISAKDERKGTVGAVVMRPLSLQTRKLLRDSPVAVHVATLGIRFPDSQEDWTHLCLIWLMGKDFQEVVGK